MPRMNGTDLCRHLIEERAGIKVLVMSCADTRGTIKQIANMPFLNKPLDWQILKAKVRELLAAPVHSGTHLQRSQPPR
jgi:response regulator RpfG family c-di-GMP phosphodiesterase